MKYIGILLSLLITFSFNTALAEEQQSADEPQLTIEEQQYLFRMKQIWDSLDRKQGEIELLNGVATLKVPKNFYYLNPTDAESILVDAWGNPPGAGSTTLGMLFPTEISPFAENAWGVTVEYAEDGYVSDEDADDIDYGDLLADMKQETAEASEERVRKGYEPIELIGWAAQPYYDKQAHKLHWAKEIRFGDDEIHTLNYNIRALGRKGVLVLNFIAGMDQKQMIDSQVDSVLAMTEFNQGSRYEEFNPDIDKVAAYGIGALVAGKLAAKTGLIAASLIFLKKFGILIVIGVGAILKKLFSRKTA